jgi:glycosyltransferase involved in cell wall biosynthesis
MRVLHIVNDLTDRGNGIVNTAVDLAMEQVRQGLVVAVASAGGAYQHLLERTGIAHFALDQAQNPVQMLRSVRRLHQQMGDFRPDIVHAHMRSGLLLAWLLRPFHQYVLVGHFHNVHDRKSIIMGLADRVIAVSKSVAASMSRSGIPRRKIRVVLNRTLGSRRVPALESIESAVLRRPSIVTVCGMNKRKGVDQIIRAFELLHDDLPHAHLYLVGDGPDRREFELQARRSRCFGHIHFEGCQAVPQAYMLSADVFVLASRRESFGLVLIEARKAGCAIVATDVDGVAEALDGGSAGILVQKNDVVALASALLIVLSDPTEKAKWQMRAKDHIADFSIDRMATEITAVYEELLCEKQTRATTGLVEIAAPASPVRMRSRQQVVDRESEGARS